MQAALSQRILRELAKQRLEAADREKEAHERAEKAAKEIAEREALL